MECTVADIIRILEALAPRQLAEDWDNSGLQVGSMQWPVKKVWVSLDPSPPVIQAACKQNVSLLVTHHPLIFKPLKSIDCGHYLGKSIQLAVEHRLCIFSVHTNLDKTDSGLNDMLAERIGLRNVTVLDNNDGSLSFGRIGELARSSSVEVLAESVKGALNIEYVRVAGDLKQEVSKVLVCSGSGSGLLQEFLASDAHVYLSGDLRYHDALEVSHAHRAMIDIGHFASEHIMVDALAHLLSTELAAVDAAVEVIAYEKEKDPFVLL